jgi:hypothetical protein
VGWRGFLAEIGGQHRNAMARLEDLEPNAVEAPSSAKFDHLEARLFMAMEQFIGQ